MGIRQKLPKHKTSSLKIVFDILFCLSVSLYFFPTAVSAFDSDEINPEQPLYLIWKYETASDYKIASDNVKELFLIDSQNVLKEINAVNGERIWESAIGGQIAGDFFVSGNYIIQLIKIKKPEGTRTNEQNGLSRKDGSDIENYIVRSINKSTGITEWQIKINPEELVGKIYCRMDGDKFTIITSAGNLITINGKDGIILQKKDLSGKFNSGALYSFPHFYVAAQNNRLKIISTSDLIVNFELNEIAPPTSLLVSGKSLFWGDRRGFINALSFPGNVNPYKWRSRKGGEILSISKTSDGILAASTDNYLYLISERSGNLIWKKRLASRAAFEPLVIGNHIIVTTVGESEALIFDLKNGKPVNRITLAENQFNTFAPVLVGKIIIFQTSEGLRAYSNVPSSKAE